MTELNPERRAALTRCFEAAVAAADPERALAPHMPEPPCGRTVIVGAGKGAAQLAAAFERLWEARGGAPLSGVVVTRYGYAAPCRRIEVREAGHPVPDAAGLAASEALFAAVSGLGADDLVVALVCGGGSALLPAPAAGLTLADEIALNEALLASGAPIGAMNCIRNAASRIKGGRLAAAAAPARVLTLVVSDVPGDDPAQVASGPTVPGAATLAEARALIETHGIDLPPHVSGALRDPPDPADPVFGRCETRVIASARLSLEAAAAALRAEGWRTAILSDAIEGEAREVGFVHAALAREIAAHDQPFAAPVALLSGGETTVTLRATGDRGLQGGRGGRNTEFLLSAALALDGVAGITAMAADTDGIDGSEDNAGAFADGGSAGRMRAAGVEPRAALTRHDAWGAFAAAGDLFVTGPTGTNVNDLRVFLVDRGA